MKHLIIAEHDGQTLSPATLPTVAAAQKIEGEAHMLVLGPKAADVANQAAEVPGIAKVFCAESEIYNHFKAENVAPLIEKLAPDYTHIWAPASTFGKNVMPRAAAKIGSQQISDISEVLDAEHFIRPIYAGNALAKVKSHDDIKFITVRGTAFDPVATTGGGADVETIPATDDTNLTHFEDQTLTEADGPSLTTARVVVSGGRGVASAENFKLLEELASAFDNAAIGASRAAVDAGYVPNDLQVGQTGKVVAPDLYIALGISGAIQHVAGMMGSKVIVAINKDPDAPIFQIADYGLVADLFEVLPRLTEAVKNG